MAIVYCDCTTSNGVTGSDAGNDGSESTPYILVATARTNAGNGDTIKIRTNSTTGKYIPTAQVIDGVGIKVTSWDQTDGLVHVDGSNLASTYIWRLEHIDSGAKNFDILNLAAGLKYGFRINANIADGEFADNTIRHNDTGYLSGAYGVLYDTLVSGVINVYRIKCIRTAFACNVNNITGTINMHQCSAYDLEDAWRLNASGGTVNTFNCISGGHKDNVVWWVQAGNLTQYYPIYIGGGYDNSRDVIQNLGAGDCLIKGGAITWPVLDSGSFTRGFANTGGGTNPEPTVDDGVVGVEGIGKIFTTPRRTSYVAFVRDDIEAHTTTGTDPDEIDSWHDLLEARGVVGSWALSTKQNDDPNFISTAEWLEIKTTITRGHDIAGHGRTGYSLSVDPWINISNTSATCTITIVNNTLTSANATLNALNIDLSTEGYLVQTLVSDINALADWTCTLDTQTYTAIGAPCRLLADVTALNVFTTKQLAPDDQRVYDYEIDGCRQDMIDNIDFTPTSWIYSTSATNDSLIALMKADGWVGGRVGASVVPDVNPDYVWKSPYIDVGYDHMYMMAVLLPSYVDNSTTENLKKYVSAWCHWAMWHGVPLVLYAHAYSQWSESEWEHTIDAAMATGIGNKSYSDLAVWAKSIADNQDVAAQYALDDAYAPKIAGDGDHPLAVFSGGSSGGGGGGTSVGGIVE